MGWKETHRPCPCGKHERAYAINDDDWGSCFSCGKRFPPAGGARAGMKGVPWDLRITNVDYRAIPSRGISAETCRHFDYGVGIFAARKDPDTGEWVHDPSNPRPCQIANIRDDANNIVAQKLRLPGKQFVVIGELPPHGLYGGHLLPPRGKMVVITTGEHDAHACHEALGGTWPVTSILTGDSSAPGTIKHWLDKLQQFDTVVLAFDTDESGKKAAEACAPLFSPGKVRIPSFGSAKDADEYRRTSGNQALRSAIWNAAAWRPDGIIDFMEFRDSILSPPTWGIPYPWPKVNQMLYGIHPEELILVTAGTGTGKSTLTAELAYSILQAKHKIGLAYLEEGIEETGKRLLSLAVNTPLHLPDHAKISDKRLAKEFDKLFGGGQVKGYNHFGSLDADVLIGKIRYMFQAEEVDLTVLDHISIMVSGADLTTDERRTLDRGITQLRSLVQETKKSIVVVSHLRRPKGDLGHEDGVRITMSQLRGSGALGQLPNTVIAVERNQQAVNPEHRDLMRLRVLKSRLGGRLGPADVLRYNHKTGRLEVTDVELPDDLTELGKPPRVPTRSAAHSDRSDF